MNLLNLRTEYSYRTAFGHVPNIIKKVKSLGCTAAGICDRNGTWGHVVWEKECKKAGIKPIFGVELGVVKDARIREKQPPNYMSFIAKTNAALKEIYELVTISTENFYYIPRIDYRDIQKLSDDVLVFVGKHPDWEQLDIIDRDFLLDLKPTTPKATIAKAKALDYLIVAMNDNHYIDPDDRGAYEVAMGRWKDRRTVPMHIMGQDEWSHYCDNVEATILADEFSKFCNVQLPQAQMVSFQCDKSLRQLCEENASNKNIDLTNPVYKERFERELTLIHEKNFEDYFYVIWDMLIYAKKNMLVGPARGSSCGSLVCYLLDITEIDPIPFGLIFERFIDVNRSDMPDIDIDFPDNKRDKVFDYLKEKYGERNVARLGSVNKFQPRMAINIACKEMDIAPWEVKNLKEIIVKRNIGDKRNDALKETFETIETGAKVLERFPHLAVTQQIEGHASHAGQHAAGMIVTTAPVSNYCSVDRQTGAVQIDKHDAEDLNLLKIDALGLRTLTVIEDCLTQIGWDNKKLLNYPLDDKDAFNLINNKKYSGIFQFDGAALQNVCHQTGVSHFNDIVALTSLARPGPLDSGGTQSYIDRKNGDEPIHYEHPLLEPILSETYGVIVYQEQLMKICRNLSHLSWGDTSDIRRAVSKSKGDEYLKQFKIKFIDGCINNTSIDQKVAERIFDNILTFGSYGFNKSHAVAYALVSYWCMVLKAHFPLPWAVANLRHPGSGDSADMKCVKLLRELDAEGIQYEPFNADKSEVDWSYDGNKIIGGLINVKGIGKKVAADIVRRRNKGEDFTPRQVKLLTEGKTPFDMLYEGKELFGDLLADPAAYNIASKIWSLDELTEDHEGEFLIMAKIISKSLRDENEPVNIEKRKTRAAERGEDIGDGIIEGQTLYLNCKVEDDSGASFYIRIGRHDYTDSGAQIVGKHKEGDWFLWKGRKVKGISMLFIDRHRFLGNKEIGMFQ